jgi:hypothetical protein
MLIAGGATAATAVAAAGGHSHTVRLTGTAIKAKAIGRSYELEADSLRSGGKVVGLSTESCFTGGTGDQCSFAIALKGGQLLGHYTFPISNGDSSVAHGKITGGLGRFTGDKGTIRVTATGHSLQVRLVYS